MNFDRYSHGGDHLGISTYVQYYFDEDTCIFILSNNESINQYRLGNALSDILHHINIEFPIKQEESRELVPITVMYKNMIRLPIRSISILSLPANSLS